MSATAILSGSGESQAANTKMSSTASRSKGAFIYIDYSASGKVDLTPADDALVHHGAVVLKTMASGDVGMYQTEGVAKITVPSATYTAGNGVIILDGAIVDSSGVFPVGGLAGQAQTVFAAILVGGVSVTEITVELHGKAFTATT